MTIRSANERCTCGEAAGQPNHYDISGYCDEANNFFDHDECKKRGGTLAGATGFHWWCACTCHPVPDVNEEETEMLALATWRRARSGER